ncbi:MAG: FemAB family PEP-CTERM system-associated protein [Candidatus Methanoperedenaceae archaeon]|nr:FemAB family PEP-CTERM system-associated protein [Candidatus Methanoperedenaceae archaeon]
MEICSLKREDEVEWDRYVNNHPHTTFYHQLNWKNVIEKSYGNKPYYICAKEKDETVGVFPLFFINNLFFGKKIISIPFAPYGGVAGNNNKIEESLIKYAIEIMRQKSADFLEIRNNSKKVPNFSANDNYITFILELDKDPQVVWRGFNNKVRNAIRKSINSKLEIKSGNLECFYRLYSKNMRDLGTPTHSKEFFKAVLSEFQEKSEIITVWYRHRPISTAILLYFKDTVISGWAALDRDYRHLNPNDLLYWNAIRNACEKNYKFFDFGRSIESSGTYRFKKPWGAKEIKLQYIYYLNNIRTIPDTSQKNTKRKMFARFWRRMPIQLANLLGPELRKNYL